MSQLTPQDGIAIISGAGSGLGRALAQRLTGQGFTTIGLGRRKDALESTKARCGDLFIPQVLDVAQTDAVAPCFKHIRDAYGPCALLINNAAVYPHRDILDETPQSFMHTMSVNFGGVLACSHAAILDMANRGRGRVLNVATFADLNPLPASAAYSVSKGAARILTRALIADLADRFPEIVISDWMPGMLNTGMGIPDGLDPDQAAQWGVALALSCEPALMGTVFEMDREILPPRGLKGKIKDALLLRRRKPRVL